MTTQLASATAVCKLWPCYQHRLRCQHLLWGWLNSVMASVCTWSSRNIGGKRFHEKTWSSTICCWNISFFFFSAFKGQTKKLHASAGWDWEMQKMPNSWYCHLKNRVLFQLHILSFFTLERTVPWKFWQGNLLDLIFTWIITWKGNLWRYHFTENHFSIYEHEIEQDLMNHWLVILFFQKLSIFLPVLLFSGKEQDIMWGFSIAWRIWFWPL